MICSEFDRSDSKPEFETLGTYPVLEELHLTDAQRVAFGSMSDVVDNREIQVPIVVVMDFDRLQYDSRSNNAMFLSVKQHIYYQKTYLRWGGPGF